MTKVFLDTDITIDLLAQREPFYIFAAQLFSLADGNKVKIYVSALSFSNIHYIVRRQTTTAQARKKLQQLKTLVTVLAVNDKIIELALASDIVDFEDAIQYYTAVENSVPILITRNTKDYKKALIKVMTTETFIKTI